MAERAGRLDVDNMLREVSSATMAEWMAWFRVGGEQKALDLLAKEAITTGLNRRKG